MNDKLGDRMKQMERENTPSRFYAKDQPVIARIDGRSFSKFTKGLMRPYDSRLSECMQQTTKYLVEHTGAILGFQQSDEITLVWNAEGDSELWFGGKLQKMVSQLAAQATLKFYQEIQTKLPPEYADKNPSFDARVWFVPNKQEASNAVLWRVQDAVKNSVSMAAHDLFGHNTLLNKNTDEKKEMMIIHGQPWYSLPDYFRHGTFVKRERKMVKFSTEELERLPLKHKARQNPDLLVERSVVEFDTQNFLENDDKLGYIFG